MKQIDFTVLPREKIILDFSHCRYIEDIYCEMQHKMEWEDWYGHNLDALWDILTGLPYRGDDFLILRPRTYHGIPHDHNLEFTHAVDQICAVFEEAQAAYGDIRTTVQYITE